MSDNVNIETWDKLGFDPYMSNSIQTDPSFTSAYDFGNQTQDASIATGKVAFLAADKIVTGILYSTDQKTYFDLDGKRIIINDGTYDRVLLGFLSGGF
jgi:hypothetical protein